MINLLHKKPARTLKPLPRIDYMDCRVASMTLRCLDNRVMRKLIPHLTDTGQTVTDLYLKAKMEQSAASQQLRILRAAHLVTYERHGKEIYYRWNMARMEKVISVVERLAAFYQPEIEMEENEEDKILTPPSLNVFRNSF